MSEQAEIVVSDTLLLAIARGDQLAFEQFVGENKKYVWKMAYKITHSIQEAEELRQEFFVAVWNMRERLPEIDNAPGYFFRMLGNMGLKRMNQNRRRKEVLEAYAAGGNREAFDSIGNMVGDKEARQELQKALSELSDNLRTAFELRWFDNASDEQIALLLNVKKGTAIKYVYLASKQVKSYLKAATGSSGKAEKWLRRKGQDNK